MVEESPLSLAAAAAAAARHCAKSYEGEGEDAHRRPSNGQQQGAVA